MVAKGKEGGGGKDWSLGLADANYYIQNGLAKTSYCIAQGSYIQYPVIHVSLNVTTDGILSESLATLLSSIK